MGISSALAGAVGAVPVGSVTAFAGSAAPSGWLLCGGQTVSRTEFSGLFLTIGTTYGSGDGSTTFALPDLRGRVPAGLDNMGGSAASRLTSTVLSASNTLGATGGTQTHTLTEAQMPSHNHSATASPADVFSNAATNNWGATYGPPEVGMNRDVPITVTIGNTGSGSAHLNTQPTIVLNYIIKAA
jgi:microcystin-dependent protein